MLMQSGFRSFPNELSGVLDIATAAKEARLWHKVRPSAGQQVVSEISPNVLELVSIDFVSSSADRKFIDSIFFHQERQ